MLFQLHGLVGLQPWGGGGLPLVQATLVGLKHTLARLKVRKEPITADKLKALKEYSSFEFCTAPPHIIGGMLLFWPEIVSRLQFFLRKLHVCRTQLA